MRLIKKMRDYINSDDREFKKFKLKYSDEETSCIKSFNISKENTYHYMGNKNNMKNLNTFLNKLGTNDKECITILEKAIEKILDNVLLAYEKEYYWIDIRVTLPNNDFDIPRWHKDGPFFRLNKKSPKFATILKGPGTLLIKSTKKTNEIYNDIKKKINDDINKLNKINITKEDHNKIDNKYRPIFAKALKNRKIIQPKNNECIIFHPQITRFKNDGALHSEPKMDTPRIFISILPGIKEDIEELNKRWSI